LARNGFHLDDHNQLTINSSSITYVFIMAYIYHTHAKVVVTDNNRRM